MGNQYFSGKQLLIIILSVTFLTSTFLPQTSTAQRRGGVHQSNRGPGGPGGRPGGPGPNRHPGPHMHHHMHHHVHLHMWGPHVFFHPGPFWHPIGFFITAIATTAIIVSIVDSNNKKKDYYYDNGTYYEKSEQDGKSGYEAVPAPIGAKVPTLPDSSTQVTVNNTDYYYYASTFYVQDSDKEHWVVVQPPVGAVVPYVPDGYEKKKVDDIEYYVYANIYYLPKSSDGDIVYEVVQHPSG